MAGPRGDHNHQEFVDLVLGTAETIARQEGLRGLGLRRIAGAIGYAPNSIYNALGGLDEIVMLINVRTLDRLCIHLQGALGPAQPTTVSTRHLARAYLDFVFDEPRLWTLLFEHALPPDRAYPDWLLAAVGRAKTLVGDVLAPMIADPAERADAVAVLWAGVHGIAALASSGKLAAVSDVAPRVLADQLVDRFLTGFRPEHDACRSTR